MKVVRADYFNKLDYRANGSVVVKDATDEDLKKFENVKPYKKPHLYERVEKKRRAN